MEPYLMDIDEVLAELKTRRQGLSADEASSRLARHGRNELAEKRKKTMCALFLGQFTDFMILILLAAAAVSGVIGDLSDAAAIVVIVVLNAALGFIQEYRSERAIAALKKMAASNAQVMRSGIPEWVPAPDLVPGDIVVFDAGKIAPADIRIIEAVRLSADEAALTGESSPVEKNADRMEEKAVSLPDRKNMLYRGTLVTYGRGAGVVTATGMHTELGRIASLIESEPEGKTPLQKRLSSFGRKLAYAVFAVCLIIFVTGLLRGEEPVSIFLVAVSLAVAAIPEALPAVVTISLAIGARKMVKQSALIRRLPAVETLGSVTYICTDKTGTLTMNRMTVEEVWCDGEMVPDAGCEMRNETRKDTALSFAGHTTLRTPHAFLLTALALSNDAGIDSNGNAMGDPTETALLSLAERNGFHKETLQTDYPRVSELPFDPDRKLMTTFHRVPVLSEIPFATSCNYVSFSKGAAEVMLERSVSVLTSEGLRDPGSKHIRAISERMARNGLRVLAVGMRCWDKTPASPAHEQVEQNMVLLGLIGIMDPPRKEARAAVAVCKKAGIVPVMITGDHPLTAAAVARRVAILDSDDASMVITGAELAALPPNEFEKRVESIRVYARVAPEQKLGIVRALQRKGHFVAMTGDGVNDAPALKAADIGVSMGISGTDVAKESSSMILLDDNFATIVKAVGEGRRIYDNIRKFIRYLLSTNSGEIWTLFLAPFFGLPIPLQPIHILWINLLTDGLPALALAVEPEEGHVMKRRPRDPEESIFAGGLGVHAVWVGMFMGAVTLSVQAWAMPIHVTHWQSMVFTLLCFLQLGHVLAIRSERVSLFQQGLFSNKPLFASVTATVFFQLLTIYVPALNPVFKTQPLTAPELAVVLVLSSAVFFAVEIEKLIKRRSKTM